MHTDDTVISQKLTVERRCPSCNVVVPQELERCPNDGTVLSVPVDAVLSSRYEFLEPIGKGGMSVVYKARHRLMGNLVAIKLLQDKLSNDPNYVKRFQNEAKAAGMMDHHSLIKVYDFGILPTGFSFLVMDFADGSSLSDVVQKEGKLPPERALPLFVQICEGLSHAHGKGIFHRDLKPSNVIVVRDAQGSERAKIVDFGIAKMQAGDDGYDAKLTATGEVFGSPYYMSPEQCTGGAVDGRSDIYAMGCLMYETLSGKLPLSGANVFETIHKQITEMPEPLAKLVSDKQAKAVSPIIEKALQKDPAERYQSFDEMLKDLREVAEHGKVKVRRRFPSAKVLAGCIAGASLLLAGAVAGCYFLQKGPFAPPAVQINPATIGKAVAADPLADDLGEESDVPDRTMGADKSVAEARWIRGMTDQFADDQWHQFGVKNIINLVQRNVGRAEIEKLAANANAKKLNLQGNPSIDDNALLPLRNHPNIEVLRLTGASITGKSIDDVFATMPKLGHLFVGHTKITPDDFSKLAHLKNLDELWLDELNLSDADLEKLPDMPFLTKIRLDDNTKLTDNAIKILKKKCPNIKILAVRRIPLTDSALPLLATMPQLKWVRASGTHFTVTGIEELQLNTPISFNWEGGIEAGTSFSKGKQDAWKKAGRFHPPIEAGAVTLAGPDATDEMLLAAAINNNVTALDVQNAPHITADALLGLRNRKMSRIWLRGMTLDERHFTALQSVTALRHVALTGSKFDHKLLKYLESCGSLRALDVSGGVMTSNADLLNLPRQLFDLNISNTPWFNNSSVALLRKHCPDLTWYHMEHTGVNDGCIAELEQVPHLRRVIVTRKQFTANGINRLLKLKQNGTVIDLKD